MPRYCSICESEFSDEIEICPTDKVALRKTKEKKAYKKLVPIYQASNLIEQEAIIKFLLANEIYAQKTGVGISQFPVIGQNHFVIEVPSEFIKQAKEKIRKALKDKVIEGFGAFI